MPVRLSICAIFKNEAPYLREWIEFHRLAGVEHFYLYNNFSEDDYRTALAPYVREGLVTLYRWRVHPGQAPAYNHCIQAHGREARWIAFIDIDEFLFAPDGRTIVEVLKEFESYGGVGVNWVMFGSGGHVEAQPGLVIENYQLRGAMDVRIAETSFLIDKTASPDRLENYRPINTQMKSIVRPQTVRSCGNPHFFKYAGGFFAVDENHRPVRHWTDSVSVNKLRINHYWSKSESEFRGKIARGRSDIDAVRKFEEFGRRDRYLNSESDQAILRHLPALRAALRQRETRTAGPAAPVREIPAWPRKSWWRRLLNPRNST